MGKEQKKSTTYMKNGYVSPDCGVFRFKVEAGYLMTEPTRVSGFSIERSTEEQGEW